jgi:hypothetical protein
MVYPCAHPRRVEVSPDHALMMSFIPARIALVLCLAMLGACSRTTRGPAAQGIRRPAAGASTSRELAATGAPSAYPYDLWLGHSLYHVEREPDRIRLVVEWVAWSEVRDGGREALFRVTNTGDRSVLVWNVRQQVCVPSADGVASSWDTRSSDYPGRGWKHAMIPPGGSEEFPIPSGTEADWRVCLLYSREIPLAQGTNRQFDGTYESVGPSVREPD